MKQKRRVPKRRFEGFTGDWRTQKMDEIAEFYSGGTPSVRNSSYYGGDIPFIRSAEINACTTELFITKKGLSNSSAKMVDVGDILYALYGATSGEVGVSKIYGAINQAILAIKPIRNINNYFLSQWLYKQKKVIVDSYLQGGQGNLSGSIVKNLSLALPTNNKEQQKIGKFFKQLDEKITLQQRRLEKAKALKTAYLAEMFPAEGERVPKRRFAGFTDEWDEHKLKDMADIVRGASPRPIQNPKWFDKNSNIGWLRISDVTEQNGRIKNLEQRLSKLGQERTRVLQEPHLLLSIAATVGKPVVNYVKTGVHDGFLIFQNPKFDREFMYQWLEMFRPMWNQYGQPGSQVNLNSDIVKSQIIMIPNIEEQQKIGSFFKKLDDTIAKHQRKLDKLQVMKQAYLHEMFV